MMKATEITKLLAVRYLAPVLTQAALTKSVKLPQLGSSSSKAMAFDRDLAHHYCLVAEQAIDKLADTEFAPVCKSSADYFGAVVDWQLGKKMPAIKNPCRDYERTLREYVWKNRGADAESA